MALSLSNFLVTSVFLLTSFVAAETRTYDFSIGWVIRNPDGQKDRPVIGINGEWPIPKIEVDMGDRLVVNVKNDLGNQSTSLHWHGLFQNGTNHMDGVAHGTQCEIAPGATFTYNFTVYSSQVLVPASLTSIDQPTWHLLVPLSCRWTVSGWTSRPTHCP
jgi:iron transport multicopper oxidase